MNTSESERDIERRLERLDKAITLRELELGLAELERDRLLNVSDAGWLASVVDGTLGSILAVMTSRWTAGPSERIAELTHELAQLRTRRLILEEARVILTGGPVAAHEGPSEARERS